MVLLEWILKEIKDWIVYGWRIQLPSLSLPLKYTMQFIYQRGMEQ